MSGNKKMGGILDLIRRRKQEATDKQDQEEIQTLAQMAQEFEIIFTPEKFKDLGTEGCKSMSIEEQNIRLMEDNTYLIDELNWLLDRVECYPDTVTIQEVAGRLKEILRGVQ